MTNLGTDYTKKNSYQFQSWMITSCRSHIMQSRCSTPSTCSELKENSGDGVEGLCDLCCYQRQLNLPQFPDMTFANNCLRIQHADGYGIEFNCLDALRLVDSKADHMKVAVANAWQEARAKDTHLKNIMKPFDWTFTTDYKGTLLQSEKPMKVSDTDEKIDIERLKVKQEILFYDDILLFEDELADNGVAECSVKIRVMPDLFFVLLRYFLRVDNVYVRICDTRLFYEVGKNYILREYCRKESKVWDVKVPAAVFCNPSELWNHLPVAEIVNDKLEFPV